MLASQKLIDAFNQQIGNEMGASMQYIAIASYFDSETLPQLARFFYQQSEEERVHMLKLIKYINERGGFAIVPQLEQPIVTFQSLRRVFEEFIRHEVGVSEAINDLVHMAFQEKDYATHNFLQWYVAEQVEEERVARELNEKMELIGEDKSGLYLFDRDILNYRNSGAGGRGRKHH